MVIIHLLTVILAAVKENFETYDESVHFNNEDEDHFANVGKMVYSGYLPFGLGYSDSTITQNASGSAGMVSGSEGEGSGSLLS